MLLSSPTLAEELMSGALLRYLFVAAITLAAWAPFKELRAQTIPHSPLTLGSTLFLPLDSTAPHRLRLELGDSVARKSYWLEGALIGGAVVGLGGGRSGRGAL
jgi:hypothetical protein